MTAALSSGAIAAKSPLGRAFIAAAVLHGVIIFGIGFKLQQAPTPAPTIEVTLAQRPTARAPDEADFIAQQDQAGSGTESKKQELTTDRVAPLDSTEFRETDVPVPFEQQLAARQPVEQRVVSRLSDDYASTDRVEEELQEGSIENQPQLVREVASLRAKLAQQRQTYSKIPRTLVLTSASARRSEQAEYLRYWIERVEQVGNENYPEEARRRQMYGAIRLAVSLERNGNVVGVEILQSSGQRVLDQAAIRIVRLAAPFTPFPATITADRIEVIRTWNFIPGNRFETSGP